MPESMKDAEQTPATNDPNASATLVIRPSSKESGKDCALWRFHYYKDSDFSKGASNGRSTIG